MKSKTEQIKEAISNENWVIAFRIAKNFFNGLTKEQKRSIDIAYECNCGKSEFYKSIGVNTEYEKENAINILKVKFA